MDDDDYQADGKRIRARVLKASQQLPDSRIAYIDYSTFGGPPEYVAGFACKNGEVIEGSEQERDDQNAREVLPFLLRMVGAKSPTFYFAPFERGFFPNT